MPRYAALLASGLLAACAVAERPFDAAPASPAQPNRFATQLAGPGTVLAPMPTAVVLLRPADLNRNRAFCQAFRQLPTAQEALARAVVANTSFPVLEVPFISNAPIACAPKKSPVFPLQ